MSNVVYTVHSKNEMIGSCVADALEKKGLEVRRVSVRFMERQRRFETLSDPAMLSLFANILAEKPKFVFFHNGEGLDEHGFIVKALTLREIPVVIWFVDNPHRFAPTQPENFTHLCINFVTDTFYQKSLEEITGSTVHHLPLATNFHLLSKGAPEKFPKLKPEISFVGRNHIQKLQFLGQVIKYFFPDMKDKDWDLLHQAADLYRKETTLTAEKALEIKDTEEVFKDKPEGLMRFFYLYLEMYAASSERMEMLEALIKNKLPITVIGDAEWEKVIPKENYHRAITYRDVHEVYKKSIINLNFSHPQLRSGVNQRVFDVLAVGGFLLTDYRQELEMLFDTKEELAFFTDKKDLLEKIEFYLNHPEERRKIAEKGKEKVISEHTYEKRIEKMLEIVDSLTITEEVPDLSTYTDAMLLISLLNAAYPDKKIGPDYLDEALSINEEAFDFIYIIALVNVLHQKKPKEIEAYIDSILENYPNLSIVKIQKALMLIGQKHYNEALQILSTELENEKYAHTVLLNLGYVYKRTGNETAAVESFRRAIDVNPNMESAYLELSELYEKQGNEQEKKALLDLAIARFPHNPDVLAYYGFEQVKKGNFTEGIDYVRQAAERNPAYKQDYQILLQRKK